VKYLLTIDWRHCVEAKTFETLEELNEKVAMLKICHEAETRTRPCTLIVSQIISTETFTY